MTYNYKVDWEKFNKYELSEIEYEFVLDVMADYCDKIVGFENKTVQEQEDFYSHFIAIWKLSNIIG